MAISGVMRDEYQKYINSPQWKTKRQQALERSKYRCEVCGFSKWSVTLEVHHKTYERFKVEPLSDLLVVCQKCHAAADLERKKKTAIRQHQKLEDARFHGWAEKVYGDFWHMNNDEDRVHEEFEQWLEKKGY